ncbi:class I SAM-dependent methyltransferase [Actinomycetospora lemnae]|uniref:Class I SAM-dependent methyltransferase n=1 Tax=Actinomycetospora lemnae TaxID=3019891 RepID=A0ABT5SQ76_9PSEU|nr:class I SAM-dependent methyltransferase [Actinomycetospora sp. DW7H6]MDD7964995.1 class I SAM-dependent methyltransferase [Actinomycetospora sp. DW7H6]
MPDNPWLTVTGGTAGPGYAARFADLAAQGEDLDGEARRVHALLGGRPSDVLDAGCGTGRVAIALARLGHRVVGADLDASMLDQARAAAPELDWRLVDLTELRLDHPVDAVVAAGNLWPLLTPGTHAAVIEVLARHLRPGGLLVAGFGLDAEHVPFTLPDGVPFPTLAAYDDGCAAAGLRPVTRTADWEGEEPYEGGGYAVSVHEKPTRSELDLLRSREDTSAPEPSTP